VPTWALLGSSRRKITSPLLAPFSVSNFLYPASLQSDINSQAAVEALHTSMQRSARGLVPAANAYFTPLSPSPVYTLAAGFIVSCPEGNAPLPFMAFPTLTSDSDSPLAMGMDAAFAYEGDVAGHYLTFVSGLAIKSVMVEGDSLTVAIPEGISGQSYVFLTDADVSGGPGSLSDSTIVAGPAIIEVTPSSPTYDVSYD
jgi:hypothetical protein